MQPPVRVLYILGSGRSGTTLLSRVLGQVEGVFSAGEARQIWHRSFANCRQCGCGSLFRECPVWSQVFQQAFGGFDKVTDEVLFRLRRSPVGTRALGMLYMPGRRALFERELSHYSHTLEALYQSIADVTGDRLIVDSSKYPTYSYLLNLVPTIDISIVHLVRDPRAVVHSWRRVKASPEESLTSMSAWYAAGMWHTWNRAGERIWRDSDVAYLRLRYEDFVSHPRRLTQKILEFAEHRADSLPFRNEHEVYLEQDHSAAGNPDRFSHGVVEIKDEERWREQLAPFDRWVTERITWPLRNRYVSYEMLLWSNLEKSRT